MEHSESPNRVERFATRFVNEDSLLGDCRHDTGVNEVTNRQQDRPSVRSTERITFTCKLHGSIYQPICDHRPCKIRALYAA